jgi:Spy/CpxP family protein refolding chaperone
MRIAAAVLLLLPLTFLACESTDDQEPIQRPRRGGWGGGYGGDGGGDMMERPRPNAAGALEFLPPPEWWRDPQLANALNLSTDQTNALDKIAKDAGDDADKIERDSGVAMRDLRTLLESDKPSEADIVAAGTRIRTMRDDVFDRQLKLLAAERNVLTKDQWQKLQDNLNARRMDRGGRDRGGYPGRGGFPGGRGGGRRPFPG